MCNLIDSKATGSSMRRRARKITLSGLVLVAVQLSLPAAANSAAAPNGTAPAVDFTVQQAGGATPIIPGQVVNGVLGNGANTGTLEDGTPFDLYSFTASQPGQRFTVTAFSPDIPPQSDVVFSGTAQQPAALLQTVTAYSPGRPVGQFGPVPQPGEYLIGVRPADLQQPSGSYRLTFSLVTPPTSAPQAPASQ